MTPDPSTNPTPPDDATAAPADEHHLVLVKHGKRYTFPCPPGGEAELMTHMSALINDPDNDLTWFDAALLCHQMGERMGDRLNQMHRQSA